MMNKVDKIDDNVSIRLRDVGHLLGSASIEVWHQKIHRGRLKESLYSLEI